MAKTMIIDLTDEQMEQLSDHFLELQKMHDDGKHGMFIAQIFPNHIKCGVLSHEKAKEVQKALSDKPGKIARSAYE